MNLPLWDICAKTCEYCGTQFYRLASQKRNDFKRLRFCSRRCAGRSGDHPRSDLELRFWEKVDIREKGCWEWTAAVNKAGYGWFNPRPESTTSHRVSWRFHFGEIPNGLCVLHKCDNRKCVRPDHLFLGTIADNVHDAVNKRRHAFGERAHSAKLKARDVSEIRDFYWSGSVMQKDLARGYGTSQSHISGIIHNKFWRYL